MSFTEFPIPTRPFDASALGIPRVYDTAQDLRDAVWNASAAITLGCDAAGDGGGGVWRPLPEAAPGTYVDDTGTTLVPTGGDRSVALGRDRSYHPNGIPVQAFGIIGDGSCEWTKWEAMFQAIGGDIGGDEMRGEPIWVADPVSSEREFVVRAPIFARDGITVNIHNCTIRNANITKAPVVEGGDPYTDSHQAVFWLGKWNPAGLQMGFGAGADPWAGQLGLHALEDGDIGDDFVTLSSVAGSSLFNPGDRIYIFNHYRQMLTICREVDPATGKIYMEDDLFWNLTKIPSSIPERLNYCMIFNLSTAEGKGTHNNTFFPSVDPLFSGPESIYLLAHAVRDFRVIGHGNAAVKSENWTPISVEAGYRGEFRNFDNIGRLGPYHNAITHTPMHNIRFYYWNYLWEFADGARNSPMIDCEFRVNRWFHQPPWTPSANQNMMVRLGQMTTHKNVKVFDSVDWSGVTGGPTLLTDDGFCYNSSIDGFEIHVQNDCPNIRMFQGRSPVAAQAPEPEDGNVSVRRDEQNERAFYRRDTAYKNGKFIFHKTSPYQYFDIYPFGTESLDGCAQGITFENVEIVDRNGGATFASILSGDSTGEFKNVKFPSYLWVSAIDRSKQNRPESATVAQENWKLDIECDGIYTYAPEESLTPLEPGAFPTELNPQPFWDGLIDAPAYIPRIARNSRILRRGMLPLLSLEEWGWSTARQSSGDLFRFDIPAGLPWVQGDEVELRLGIQFYSSVGADRTITVKDRATDADAWKTILTYTQLANEGAATPDWESMWHELLIRMKVAEVIRTGDVQTPGQVIRLQWVAQYLSPVRTEFSACSRGDRSSVDYIDLNTDGRQLVVHVEQGVSTLGTNCTPQIKCNLRWWPR